MAHCAAPSVLRPAHLESHRLREAPGCVQSSEPCSPLTLRIQSTLYLPAMFVCLSQPLAMALLALGNLLSMTPSPHSPWKNQMWPWASSKAASTGLGSPCQWREASAG